MNLISTACLKNQVSILELKRSTENEVQMKAQEMQTKVAELNNLNRKVSEIFGQSKHLPIALIDDCFILCKSVIAKIWLIVVRNENAWSLRTIFLPKPKRSGIFESLISMNCKTPSVP